MKVIIQGKNGSDFTLKYDVRRIVLIEKDNEEIHYKPNNGGIEAFSVKHFDLSRC